VPEDRRSDPEAAPEPLRSATEVRSSDPKAMPPDGRPYDPKARSGYAGVGIVVAASLPL
jgi:hypothetical protein